MKGFLKNTAVCIFSLFILSEVVDGVIITGGLPTLIIGGVMFSFLSTFLRPLLRIITFPINVLTLGAASLLINAALLYILSLTISDISIVQFTFQGASFWGFVIPRVFFNSFFAFIASSLVLSAIIKGVYWLVGK